MFKKQKAMLVMGCLLCTINAVAQNGNKTKILEVAIAKTVKEVSDAVVKISDYDTTRKRVSPERFSGVVVSKDGYILTAAHATQPKQMYQVTFPDGKKVIAKGLGRVSIGELWPTVDLAMLQITDKGNWPVARMGWSSDVRNGQPCIGISYPGTVEQNFPNIRLGRISSVHFSEGNFESTSKMEPGDSGGPLFDINGLLIGIHSWIKPDEQQNYEVPIDLFRKYWDSLLIPITYYKLPQGKEILHQPAKSAIDTIPQIDLLARVNQNQSNSVVHVESMLRGRSTTILGTIISTGDRGKAGTWVITKSTMVGDSIRITINGKDIRAQMIKRDSENDLALLRADSVLPLGIKIDNYEVKDGKYPIGQILISALDKGRSQVGITSTSSIKTQLKYSAGYLGAYPKLIDGKLTFTNIAKDSPAQGILEKDDQVLAINHVPVLQVQDYKNEMIKYYQNDSIRVDLIRNGQKRHYMVLLGTMAPSIHMADQYKGGRSARSDGFGKIYMQDAAILAEDCGGPVFDLKGNFCGINIARNSRTSTVVLPPEVLLLFIKAYI